MMKRLSLALLVCLSLAASARAQNPFSLINFGATAVDTNSGNKSAGTLRIVIATDQPALTNKLLVTPDLPALASTSTKQSDGTQKTQIVDGSGNVIASTSNNLNVQCANCSGSGASAADEASFTEGTSTFAPIGGYFKTVITALTTGQQGTVALTPSRSLHSALYDAAGNALLGSKTSANSIPVVIASDQGAVAVSGTFWQATQPVSGTVTTTPPANASTNVAQIAGTTTDVNSGTKSAGTIRVVIATDQPALTNKLLVTPDSVALPANQSINAAQLAGTTTDTNSGNKSAGTLRVVLATDQPALTNKLLVTPDSVALPANQSVNVAQMNGVTTSMNTGSSDTGTLRVVLADGLLECVIVSAASTNSNNCKGSAGNFFGFDLYNTTTTVYYLRLYNASSAPTCSSATGFIRSIPIPPAGAAGAVGGAIRVLPQGVAYGTGVGYCLTGGSSSTDNTNAAVGIFGTVLYR